MKEIRYVRAITEALREEMLRDPNVFVAGEDVAVAGGPFSATRGLYEEFGEKRVKDTPISETAIVGLAAGAALVGLRPVIEIMFMDFLPTCMDQIVNQVAKLRFMSGGQFKLPLVIRTPAGAGINAGPQHSQSLEACFAHVPGLKVVMPSTVYDVKGLLKASIRDDDPVLFIEHKAFYARKGEVPEEEYVIPLGKADIKRSGRDITVVATAAMVFQALMAAEKLKNEGIDVEVIDLRTIVPLDKKTILDSVRKTGRLLVVHEAVKYFGIGAEIAALVIEEAFDYLDSPIKRIGAPYAPVPFSRSLEKEYIPGSDEIVTTVKDMLGKNM